MIFGQLIKYRVCQSCTNKRSKREAKNDETLIIILVQKCIMLLLSVIFFGNRYDVMKRCWQEKPEQRPPFSELVAVISTSLEGMSGYLDLTTQPLAPAQSESQAAEEANDTHSEHESECTDALSISEDSTSGGGITSKESLTIV